MHIIAAKAVCFKEAAEPAFGDYQRQIVANAQRLAAALSTGRLPPRLRRHRQPPDAGRRVLAGHHRQGGRSGARQGRHHRQQERDSVRSEPADGRERHPHRHAGRDHAAACANRRWTRSASFIARALQTPDDERALATVRTEVEELCRKFPLYPERAADGRSPFGLTSVSASSRATARSRRARPASKPRAGQREMAAAVARRLRRRRRAARRGGHRHRQDARLPRARDPEPAARARLHRHQEPAGADLLQGHARAARGARRPVHGHVHEGPRELSVPAPLGPARSRHRRRSLARRTTMLAARSSASGPPRTETGDRAETGGPARGPPVLERIVGNSGNLPRQRVPALRRLLRHPDAPARRGVRHRHRQPPPAVRRRGGPPERVRRGHSRMHERRSWTKRISSRTWRRSTSASASATTASRNWRATRTRVSSDAQRDAARRRSQKAARAAARPRARRSSPSSLRRTRTDGRPTRRGARARDGRVAGAGERAAAKLTGALDVIESTLAAWRCRR